MFKVGDKVFRFERGRDGKVTHRVDTICAQYANGNLVLFNDYPKKQYRPNGSCNTAPNRLWISAYSEEKEAVLKHWRRTLTNRESEYHF